MTSTITNLFLLNHVYPVLFQPGGYNSQLLPKRFAERTSEIINIGSFRFCIHYRRLSLLDWLIFIQLTYIYRADACDWLTSRKTLTLTPARHKMADMSDLKIALIPFNFFAFFCLERRKNENNEIS